eukprot:403355777
MDSVSTAISGGNVGGSSYQHPITVQHNMPYSSSYQHSNIQQATMQPHSHHYIQGPAMQNQSQHHLQSIQQASSIQYAEPQSEPQMKKYQTYGDYQPSIALNPEQQIEHSSRLVSKQTQQFTYENQQELIIPTAVSSQIAIVPQQQLVAGEFYYHGHLTQSVNPDFQQAAIHQQQQVLQNPYAGSDSNLFNGQRWIYTSEQLLLHVNQMTFENWISFFKELELLFNSLSYAFGKAFSDLRSKIDTLLRNDKYWTSSGVNLIYIQDIIDYEISQGLVNYNGKGNQAKHLPANDFRREYASSARTILRNLWLLDFMYMFLHLAYVDRHSKLSNCASQAYKETLAHHHNWTLRKAAEICMWACPDREPVLRLISYEQVNQIKANIWKIKESLWNFYRQRNIQNLP